MLDRKDRGGGGLSTSTAKQAQVALNLMLEKARREKLVSENPLADVRAIKVSTVNRRAALTSEQAVSVWRSAITMPAGTGARHALQLMSGMRQGEHTGAVLEDLHLADDGTGWYEVHWKLEALDREHGCQGKTGAVTCHFSRAAYCPEARWIKPDGFEGRHLEGAWWLTCPKHYDPGSVRAVPLSAEVVLAIGRWLDATKHHDRRHGLVWCNEDGSPITPAQDNKELRALFADAGIPDGLTGHVLRHSFVTIAAAQPGADISVIAKISGHSAKVAEGIYRHHTEDERRRAVRHSPRRLQSPRTGKTSPEPDLATGGPPVTVLALELRETCRVTLELRHLEDSLMPEPKRAQPASHDLDLGLPGRDREHLRRRQRVDEHRLDRCRLPHDHHERPRSASAQRVAALVLATKRRGWDVGPGWGMCAGQT